MRSEKVSPLCQIEPQSMVKNKAWRFPVGFGHILYAVIGLLAIEGRLSYRRLQLEFDLDDRQLEALRFELTEVKHLAVE
jgi:hypothetical protein